MKTAGDILSALFDERFVKKAQGYSRLFDSWADITAKNGIAAAADHSRIKDLDRGILLIEMDHPGWKQILQTKQSKLLNDFRRRFPELDISGLSLILGQGGSNSQEPAQEVTQEHDGEAGAEEAQLVPSQLSSESSNFCEGNSEKNSNFDAIEDDEFKDTLKKLGQTIAEKEKKQPRQKQS